MKRPGKTLRLKSVDGSYRVRETRNTIEWSIGVILSKAEVQRIIMRSNFNAVSVLIS